MTLPQEVRDYYYAHFAQLDDDKQFHFATRLYGWSQDQRARQLLETLRPDYVKKADNIQENLRELLDNPPAAKINALSARQPYFDKYPALRGRIFALFRVRHLRDIYGVDAREQLLSLVSMDELEQMADDIEKDHPAIRTLSTYAINYLYLVRQIIFGQPESMTGLLRSVETIATHYDRSRPADVQLLIYLYTHCIIGASNFYLQPVPQSQLEIYTRMVRELEPLISSMFEQINLDNKFEYLVCCRIVGYETPLFQRIYEEAQQSISPEGTFIIDTINENRQGSKTSLSDSEHRNVLFVMSSLDYQPTKTS